ncbi:MAG TPA: hypothetical protein VEA69_00445 [Tepidisphaeraceae bacterium]|nr:hypothetical protein [Tepidisphaeraceae bacterium]
MVAQVQRVRRVRPSSPAFAHADILSRLGETICVTITLEAPRHRAGRPDTAARTTAHPELLPAAGNDNVPPIQAAHSACEFDEDPERWDGLS